MIFQPRILLVVAEVDDRNGGVETKAGQLVV